jgi:hypothetical protein
MKTYQLRMEELEDRSVPAVTNLAGLASIPVVGNWGGGSQSGIGVFDPGTATWSLRSQAGPGAPDVLAPFRFGAPGWIPVVGDWTGSGRDGIGVVDPSTMTWYLKSTAGPGAPDIAPFRYGAPGWIPVVGDWDGSGTTTAGVVDPATETWYLRNSNTAGAPDIAPFAYGAPGWVPVVGDWDGNGTTTPGVVDPVNGTWYLRDANSPGAPDAAQPFAYGGGSWYYLAQTFKASPASAGEAASGAHDELVAFDPTGAVWAVRSGLSGGAPDMAAFRFGTAGRADSSAFDGNAPADELTGNNTGPGNDNPPSADPGTNPGGDGDLAILINANQTPPTEGSN